jgi:hypothetical protein
MTGAIVTTTEESVRRCRVGEVMLNALPREGTGTSD